MKVLVNAYSCSPFRGSEPGMGWNWCINMARYCELFIITEANWKENIESVLPNLKQRDNMHFYYNAVPNKALQMAKNQGDWRFYWYYRQWQKRTLKIAREICKEHNIDIIHHLNWTGFREPGFLWKIKGPKYVWGPVGGMDLCPIEYIKGIDSALTNRYRIKNFINGMQFRLENRVGKAARRADLIFCDGDEGVRLFKKIYGVNSIQINENGCTVREDVKREKECGSDDGLDILWVGRFLPTKLLDLALRCLSQIDDGYKIKLHILGGGNFEDKYRSFAVEKGLNERIEWHGQVSHEEVQHIMRSADLFFFTSVVEGTPAVIMECISNGLPILCFDTCGFGPLVDESIGMKIKVTTPEQSIREFSDKIIHLYNNRDELKLMSDNCSKKLKTISWESLAEKLMGLYSEILTK